MNQGRQKHLSFSQAKYNAGIMHLFGAAYYPCKSLDGSICCMWSSHPRVPRKTLWECICWLSTSQL